MELYILDSLNRREDVVDDFISLVWTERFSSIGDFELVVSNTLTNRLRFKSDVKLLLNESKRVMIIESIEKKVDEEYRHVLNISGRSLEKILDERVGYGSLSGLNTNPKWALTGTPGNIARKMFHDICVAGILDTADIIPNIVEQNVFPTSTIAESTDLITMEFELASLYTSMKNVCDLYDLGFRLVRNAETSTVYFDVYAGCDRTSHQTNFPAVIFSQELDNLKGTSEFMSSASYKTVAYVITPIGSGKVYAIGVDPVSNGFDRRVLVVRADDLTNAATLATDIQTRGNLELMKSRNLFAFDGEINESSGYKYGLDYNVGDIVEMRDVDGVVSNLRVTEQIFVSDAEGDRSYPTLSVNIFINPDSWLAWNYNKVWSELGATEYWADA